MTLGTCPLTEAGVEVLFVSPSDADHTRLRHIISHSNWRLCRVLNCGEAVAFAEGHPCGVVIADLGLPDGCWKDLLARLSKLSRPPNLIVFSRLADELLWAEVLNLGGYDVLLAPFDREELFRVGSAAWLDWKRRCSRVDAPDNKGAESSASSRPDHGLFAAAGGR